MSERMIHLTIDGVAVEVPPETTVLTAAAGVGITIPTLCYLKGLAPDGSCRFCVVEILGGRKAGLFPACSEHCAEGMEVFTRSERVVEARRFVLELLLSNHDNNCFSCPQNGGCKLQDYCLEYGVMENVFAGRRQDAPVDDSNPYFNYDPKKCIMCRRCQRTCEQITGKNIISLTNRGFETKMGIPYAHPWRVSNCGSCGNCVEVCPVGALTSKSNQKNYRAWEVTRTKTTCPLCENACAVELLTKGGKVVELRAAGVPGAVGLPCGRGHYTYWKTLDAGRVTAPMMKDPSTGVLKEAGWEAALAAVAEHLKDNAAVLTSRSTTDEEIECTERIAAAAGVRHGVFGGYGELLRAAHGADALLIYDADAAPGCRSGQNCSYCQIYCDTVDVSVLNETGFVAVAAPALTELTAVADVVLPMPAFSEQDGTFRGKSLHAALPAPAGDGLAALLERF